MKILGISAFYHDSAACLVNDGDIAAAAQEERFTRKKHDPRFPQNAIKYILESENISVNDVDVIVFYDKSFTKFERIISSYMTYAPRGVGSFLEAIPSWLKMKLNTRKTIRERLGYEGKILFCEHHESHAASAFYPSPYKEAAFLTVDGVGEWATTTFGVGKDNDIEILYEIDFPHSLGLLYSAFTYYTGFRVNSGEYKVMGLAPYGEPRYVKDIMDNLIDVKEDGSFKLNMEYFSFAYGLTMTNKKFDELFKAPPRKPESMITQREMDIAASVQKVTEIAMDRMTRHIYKITGMENLVLAGGVALNCVANGKILRKGPFKNIWIEPAAGDAGGALGAALRVWYKYYGNERKADGNRDYQKATYLGPGFSSDEIREYLNKNNIPYTELKYDEIPDRVADIITDYKVVGWFQGRMEFGPRALGARSIIGDARSPEMQSIMNLKIKFRESFRPFAPSVIMDKVNDYFEMNTESPYMLLVADVKKSLMTAPLSNEELEGEIEKLKMRLKNECEELKKQGRIDEAEKIEKAMCEKDYLKFRAIIHHPRSSIPAITHVDGSARIQTVSEDDSPLYYRMIRAVGDKTGYAVVINTSFNVRGEPIVCSPEDAYRCFMRTGMDFLVMENFILDKIKQPEFKETTHWLQEFQLD